MAAALPGAVFCFYIAAAPYDESLRAWALTAHVSASWNPQALPAGLYLPKLTGCMSRAQSLNRLLHPAGITWEWIEGTAYYVIRVLSIPRCAPQLGAYAPLPPCRTATGLTVPDDQNWVGSHPSGQ